MIENYIKSLEKYIPTYWPMTTFVHHNPLHGFEDMPFKEALKKASKMFDAKVYMSPEYYIELYKEGTIKRDILEKNIMDFLKTIGMEKYFPEAKKFITELSPNYKLYKDAYMYNKNTSKELLDYFYQKLIKDEKTLFEELTENLMLCEIIDAIYNTNYTDIIEKEIVEFVSRFLDEGQTTMSMPEREKGMFEAFKLYESIHSPMGAKDYGDLISRELSPKDQEKYILNHLLKDFGWAGFIKYRENNPDYYFQQKHPASVLDYVVIRLHFEKKYLKDAPIINFKELYEEFDKNKEFFVLKLLKAKKILSPKYVDELEQKRVPKEVLKDFLMEEVLLESSRAQNIYNELLMYLDKQKSILEFAFLLDKIKEEEGYIWLKSLEDSYIRTYTAEFLQSQEKYNTGILASAVFCIDVRSETIRRHTERLGRYSTYGVAGFFATPIAFVEFDKGHELNLCPVFIKPIKIIFELPQDAHEEYKSKHHINYTFKKTLEALKNNPYTPFFMVEAMGWLFGVNLFGKTLFPNLTLKTMSFIKAKKPKTHFTIDAFTEEEINFYATKFFIEHIKDAYHQEFKKHIKDDKAREIFEAILKDKPASTDPSVLELLKTKYDITKENYEFQKEKLKNVGYSKEEQVNLVENFLRLIGLTKDIPKFVMLIAHGSTSDNNPFESALDCGACGGSAGLPNVRVFANIANKEHVKDTLLLRGIDIRETIFIPGLHNTTTDEIEFYDTDTIPKEDMNLFENIVKDFKIASGKTREERAKLLPYTGSPDRIPKGNRLV